MSSLAQNTWTGDVNNRWNNAGNWSFGYVPIAGEDVLIRSSARVIIPSGYSAQCANIDMGSNSFGSNDTLIIQSGGSLESEDIFVLGLFSNLVNNGNLDAVNGSVVLFLGAACTNNGKMTCSDNRSVGISNGGGTFINNDTIIGGRVSNGSGTFENHGYIKLNLNSTTQAAIGNSSVLSGSPVFVNTGIIIKETEHAPTFEMIGGTFTNETSGMIRVDLPKDENDDDFEFVIEDGTFTNRGTVLVNNSGISGGKGVSVTESSILDNKAAGTFNIGLFDNTALTISTGSNVINRGDMEIVGASNGDMILGTSFFENNGGTLSGDGTISITSFTNNGIMAPGQSPGKITRDGNSNIGSALYRCEIAGTAGAGVAGGHDQYEVTQNLNLAGGQLNVSLLDGFVPEIGDQFTIITVGNTMSNTFGTINYPTLPGNRIWQIDYTSNDVILQVVLNPLPIELHSFDVKDQNGIHQLEWRTASEINGSHFEVEHSTNGQDWRMVGRVAATGDSQIAIDYSFAYAPSAMDRIHYYRLKMVDRDETFDFSEVRSLETLSDSKILIAPNPFNDEVQINTTASHYKIYDSLGAVVYESSAQNEVINLGHLPGGMYLLKVFDGRRAETIKLFKPRK